MTAPAPRSLADIRMTARAELAKRPVMRPWWQHALALTVVAIGAAGIGVLSGRHGLIGNRLPVAALLSFATALLLLLGWSVREGLRPGSSRLARWLPLVLGVGVWLVWGGSGLPGPVTPFLRSAEACGLAELGIAAVPLFLALYFLTGFAPSAARSIQLGASAALAGLLMLHLHCPDGTPAHLAAGHLLPAVFVVLACWTVRARLRSRSMAP